MADRLGVMHFEQGCVPLRAYDLAVEGMRAFAKSVRLFLWGMLRHWYVLLPGVTGGGLDIYERITGDSVAVEPWFSYTILGVSVFVSAAWAYHDLRMASEAGKPNLALAQKGDLLARDITAFAGEPSSH